MAAASPASPAPPARPEPTGAHERVEALDVIRGFALLGVLAMNVHYWFRTSMARYELDPHPYPAPVDVAVDWASAVLLSTKFMTLFSILFGIGLSIQLERAEARGARFGRFAARRLGALLLLGVLHILLLWMGDILHLYALIGFLLLLFLRRKTKTLLVWIAALLALPVLVVAIVSIVRGPKPPSPPDVEVLRRDLEASVQAYGHGGWLEVARYRLRHYVETLGSLAPAAYMALTAFLVGLVVWRTGVVQRPGEHLPRLRRTLIVGLTYGVLLCALEPALRDPPAHLLWLRVSVMALQQTAVVALALAYGAGLLLLLQRPRWQRWLRPLADVGRMALTNYLMQSVLCGLVFYGYGLGLYDRLSPAEGLIVTAVIYTAQLFFSRFWVRRFRHGPAEWLWRSLTYGKAQPMRA